MDNTIQQQTTPTPEDLTHVTVELYKKNFELIQTNKTLSILRQINEIVLSTVTDTTQIAQQVADLLISDAGFKIVSIYLIDKKNNVIKRLAISKIDLLNQITEQTQDLPNYNYISTSVKENIIVQSILQKKMIITHNLSEVLSFFTQEEAKTIEETGGITTTVVYPLIIRSDAIGAIVMSIGAPENAIPQYQKDLMERLVNTVGIAINDALLYQHIEEVNSSLKQLDQMKDEFVSLASHELRSPLTIIKGYLATFKDESKGEFDNPSLQDSKLTAVQKKCITMAAEATDGLIQLVNEMLDISRIESGKLTLSIEQKDIFQLTQSVITEISSLAQQQNLTVTCTPPSFNTMVFCDMNKTKEVLINIMSNAIKFTPSGGNITITFTKERDMIITHIKDSGKGITQEDITKLFQKFSRIEKKDPHISSVKGTGLGLYLSKEIIETENGKIWAESEGENKGTTFSFSLKALQ